MKKTILLFSTITMMILQNHAQTVPLIVFNSNLTYGQVSDVDGNTYKTIVIGTQTWMAENLRVTHYNDGTAIPLVTNAPAWRNDTTSAYCNYTTNSDTINTYGRLYNWYTVNTGKLCPVGWHVASDGEWNILEKYLDSSVDTTIIGLVGTNIGDQLKEAGTTHWLSPSTGTNSSGFTALPGGSRGLNGTFYNFGDYGYWWSSTKNYASTAWFRLLYYDYSNVNRNHYDQQNGFSVRCLQNY